MSVGVCVGGHHEAGQAWGSAWPEWGADLMQGLQLLVRLLASSSATVPTVPGNPSLTPHTLKHMVSLMTEDASEPHLAASRFHLTQRVA